MIVSDHHAKENMNNKRNGTIELLRFVFASGVIMTHSVGDLYNWIKVIGHIGNTDIVFFKNGNIGVEFFFLLSGFFMAKDVHNKLEKHAISENIGEETISYMWSKVKSIFPCYLIACLMTLGVNIYLGESFLSILDSLPSLFFLQQTGAFETSIITISWYISSMFIAIAVLYPFCKRFYNTFTVLAAPILGLLTVGAIVHQTGTLGNVTEWSLFTYKSNLRAIAEMALGTTCFEVSRRISLIDYKPKTRKTLSLIAFICYSLSFLYMNCDVSLKFGAHVLIALCIAVTITLSGAGWISQKGYMQRELFFYLGRISLPLYLFQNIPRYLVPILFCKQSPALQCALMYLGSVLLALVSYALLSRLHHYKT